MRFCDFSKKRQKRNRLFSGFFGKTLNRKTAIFHFFDTFQKWPKSGKSGGPKIGRFPKIRDFRIFGISGILPDFGKSGRPPKIWGVPKIWVDPKNRGVPDFWGVQDFWGSRISGDPRISDFGHGRSPETPDPEDSRGFKGSGGSETPYLTLFQSLIMDKRARDP